MRLFSFGVKALCGRFGAFLQQNRPTTHPPRKKTQNALNMGKMKTLKNAARVQKGLVRFGLNCTKKRPSRPSKAVEIQCVKKII